MSKREAHLQEQMIDLKVKAKKESIRKEFSNYSSNTSNKLFDLSEKELSLEKREKEVKLMKESVEKKAEEVNELLTGFIKQQKHAAHNDYQEEVVEDRIIAKDAKEDPL